MKRQFELRSARWLSTAILGLTGYSACAPDTGVDEPRGRDAVGGSGGLAGAGTGAGSTPTPISDVGSGGTFIDYGAGGATLGGASSDAGCFATAFKAEQVVTPITTTVTTYKPFDMFIIYDQSGSMNDKAPGGTRWDAVKGAVTGFVNDPRSAGIGVGIGYFPFVDPAAPPVCFQNSDCGNFGPCVPVIFVGYCQGADACLPRQYATPDVAIETLPGVAPKIVESVNKHRPGGGTPTSPALAGALDYAKPWATQHPDKKTIVVLATDGDPSGCTGNTVQDVANVAASGLAAEPSVKTFVIGVGRSLTSLNAIAAAGGTQQALIVDAATGDPKQQFLEAMNRIRDSVTTTETHTETQSTPVPCTWTIPPSPNGRTFDKHQVNVDYAAGNATSTRVGAVGAEIECASVDQGWYYDNPTSPTKVLVCPQTCTTIQAIPNVTVQVVFGCTTQQAIIR